MEAIGKLRDEVAKQKQEIVRGVEGYIVAGSKHIEIGTKLSEDSRKYGSKKTCTSGNTLSRAALSFGRARAQMEKECRVLLKALGTQVAEPLRAMIVGVPLEDAGPLAQRYVRMRQEAEAQICLYILTCTGISDRCFQTPDQSTGFCR